MKRRLTWFMCIVAASALLSAGCGEDGPESPNTPETPETPDTPETPETPDTPETPEVPEEPVPPTVEELIEGEWIRFGAAQDERCAQETACGEEEMPQSSTSVCEADDAVDEFRFLIDESLGEAVELTLDAELAILRAMTEAELCHAHYGAWDCGQAYYPECMILEEQVELVIEREYESASARHFAEITSRLRDDTATCQASCSAGLLEPAAACEVPPEEIPSAEDAQMECLQQCAIYSYVAAVMKEEVAPRLMPTCYGLFVDFFECEFELMSSCDESPEAVAACDALQVEGSELCDLGGPR